MSCSIVAVYQGANGSFIILVTVVSTIVIYYFGAVTASTLKNREIVSQVSTVFSTCTKMQSSFAFYQCRTSMNYTAVYDRQLNSRQMIEVGKSQTVSYCLCICF